MAMSGDRTAGTARLVALVVAAMVALACGITPDQEGSGQPDQPTPSSTVGTQEDGTMTAEEFDGDIKGAVTVAEQYWGEQFKASGQRFAPIRQVIAYQRDGEVTCGGAELPRNNAAYCSPEDFIAYDVNWAAAAFQKIGDAFLFYLLGHEYAHGIQVRLGIQYNFTIQQELQADCMAGAYIGDSVKAKALTLQDGDIEELQRGLLAVADAPGQPWFSEGAHGTAEQRTASFFAGYQNSLTACGLN
jgi:uncharacterized protein